MHIRLFHKTNSRSQRILWLLEELQLDYELIFCNNDPENSNLDQIENQNLPTKFPTVKIYGNDPSDIITLAETAAISDYLSYLSNDLGISQLNPQEVHLYYYWKNFTEATFMPDLALKQIFTAIIAKTPLVIRPVSQLLKFGFDRGYLNNALNQHMLKINEHLKDHAYIAGNHFTIADLLLWFPLLACVQSSPTFERLQHIQCYLLQIQSRPAFQRALEKGQWSAPIFKLYWSKAWS
ncbi:glutathione binding-like protein [Acinetobacter sp. ANC 4648]|uniref:glutathione binding-like protein n=1 Tax=Acinetobacter sp. ANC 4648 TaxID=1977875 RepID=UPI000A33D42F|nr:glutathione binding-like protein [Acinetobacter sp. ANC 4648]OTG81697.1 glutathione S-transferase [Acinetobacter sp. ANC 4648]